MRSCPTCGHEHENERCENCDVCGRCPPPPSALSSSLAVVRSTQPQQILSPYLFLGSVYDAHRLLNVESLRPLRITHYLNVDPSFYIRGRELVPHLHFHKLADDINTRFDEAFAYIQQCERDGGTVLVHCTSGNERSAAVVVAYLMKLRLWPLQEALGWLRHRRRRINITPDLMQQLEEYEQEIFPNGITNGNVKHH